MRLYVLFLLIHIPLKKYLASMCKVLGIVSALFYVYGLRTMPGKYILTTVPFGFSVT